jgi:hypothetical protein
MSLLDDLKPKPPGSRPTAFEVLSSRRDWQTAAPESSEERRWYSVGYQMAPDREMSDLVSPVVPVPLRFFWALGLADGLGQQPSRIPPPKPDGTGGGLRTFGIIGGVFAAALGIGLLVASSDRHE